jgi:hypothetical protein
LEGARHQTVIYTDHRNLEFFPTTKVLNRHQARWSEELNSFNFVIQYRPGKENTKADLLLRRADYFPKGAEAGMRTQLPLICLEQWKGPQEGEEEKKGVIAVLAEAEPYTLELQLEADIKEVYEGDKKCCQGLLKAGKSQGGDFNIDKRRLLLHRELIYVPDSTPVQLQIMKEHHHHPKAGHRGRDKTLEMVKCNFFWPKMATYIGDYVETCRICSRIKPMRHKPYGELMPLLIPEGRWQSISTDMIVKLLLSKDLYRKGAPGYNSIQVVVDRLTKRTYLTPCYKAMTSEDLIYLYME